MRRHRHPLPVLTRLTRHVLIARMAAPQQHALDRSRASPATLQTRAIFERLAKLLVTESVEVVARTLAAVIASQKLQSVARVDL